MQNDPQAGSKVKNKQEFLKKVARMYYMQNMSQQEIANELKVGRSSIARFLAEAKEMGIVKISIASDIEMLRNKDLEQKLRKRFNIDDCLVTNGEDGIVDDLAVEYLDEILPYSGTIGITGGYTTHSLGQKLLGNVHRPNVTVVQLMGSVGSLPETSVAKLYADALSANGVYLPAPLLIKEIQNRNVLIQEPTIMHALDAIKQTKTVIVGIGCNKANDNAKYLEMFDFIDREQLYKKTIGDIGFHFFNNKGQFTISEIENRIIGFSVKDFLKTKQRIGIAYNTQKSRTLAVTLKYGIINVLISNSKTVQAVLNENI